MLPPASPPTRKVQIITQPKIIYRGYTIEDKYAEAFIGEIFLVEVTIDKYIARWKYVKEALLESGRRDVVTYFERTRGMTEESSFEIDSSDIRTEIDVTKKPKKK